VTTPLLQVEWIPPGDAGGVETLLRMRGLVRQAAGDAGLVQEARRVVGAGKAGPDETVDAIEALLTTRLRMRADPVGLEFLQSPAQLLAQLRTGYATGDCDDAAILAAFLGVAHGIPYRFRAMGFQAGGPLLHVVTLLRVPGGWRILDTTRLRTQAVPLAVRTLEVDG
jgi:transglutaminase-like putative cysteine protease